MHSASRLLLSILVLVPSLAAQPWHVDAARLRGLAQDSDHQVWAIGYSPSQGIYHWGDDRWNPVNVDGVPNNAEPIAITGGSDGAVYCLWSSTLGAHAVTRHRGNTSNPLAQVTGSLSPFASIFIDPRGNVWITEAGPHIYRVTPQGKAECIYTIPDDDYVAFGPTQEPQQMFNPVHAIGDSLGRIWFWSGGFPTKTNFNSIQGLLIYDGEGFKSYPHLVDVPYNKVSALDSDDAEHMWMSMAENRLYRVDIKTLTAAAVSDPEPGAFRHVNRIFRNGDATYVVSLPPAVMDPEPGGEGRIGALWRLRDGEWKRVVNGLDMRPQIGIDPIRPFVATPAGLWVGAYGTGPWLIPPGAGQPVHIDWHYNYPLAGSESLISLPDGRLLLATSELGSIALKPADLLAAFQSTAGIRTLNPWLTFVQDGRGHLWGTFFSSDKFLSEWDGKSWSTHPLPFAVINPPRYRFATDSGDRVWVIADEGPCQGPAAVLNSSRGNFDVYPDFPTALQAQLPQHPSLHMEDYPYTAPSFSTDGRIGYADRCGKLHYFNGEEWRNWSRQDINGDSRPVPLLHGRAFFDQAGNLATNLQGTIWEYTPKDGWRPATSEPGPRTDPDLIMPQPSPLVPRGCEFGSAESIAKDRLGTFWLTHRGQLYRAIPGLCLPQTSSPEHQPFIDGRTVNAALVDPQGNAFLETYLHTTPVVGEYVVIDARPPLPQMNLRASVGTAGAVKLHFDSAGKGKIWFTWRVDNEAWTDPSEGAEATVTGLAEGKHRIEAEVIDERLQITLTPAVAEVEIPKVNQNELAALIEQLKDPDYSVRDAAVAGLARQPALALPLLCAAREKATPDLRWWIDAAIQQINEGVSAHKGH